MVFGVARVPLSLKVNAHTYRTYDSTILTALKPPFEQIQLFNTVNVRTMYIYFVRI